MPKKSVRPIIIYECPGSRFHGPRMKFVVSIRPFQSSCSTCIYVSFHGERASVDSTAAFFFLKIPPWNPRFPSHLPRYRNFNRTGVCTGTTIDPVCQRIVACSAYVKFPGKGESGKSRHAYKTALTSSSLLLTGQVLSYGAQAPITDSSSKMEPSAGTLRPPRPLLCQQVGSVQHTCGQTWTTTPTSRVCVANEILNQIWPFHASQSK
eukprot:scaffold17704_cov21-Prasinocladus_malaysianus.AAC.1